MIVFQVAFVLVNLAVPYWIWSNKSKSDLPPVERSAMQKTIFNLVESAGSFPPCDSQDVVDTISELCEQSRKAYANKKSERIERRSSEIAFHCEVDDKHVALGWWPEETDNAELKCLINIEEHVAYAPTFTMNLKGQLQSIEYTTYEGDRQATSTLNCRKKLKRLIDSRQVPQSEEQFLESLASIPKDPPDPFTANRVCLIYDSAPAWSKWRKLYYEPED